MKMIVMILRTSEHDPQEEEPGSCLEFLPIAKNDYVNEAVEEIDGGCKSSLKRVKDNPKEKHLMLLPCKEICPRKCTTKFSN